MAKVSFGKDGQLINAQTGQVLSKNINGKYVINSDGAEYKTLQEMGAKQPQIPQELQEITPEYSDMFEEEQNVFQNVEKDKTQKKETIQTENIKTETKLKLKSSFITKKTKYEVTPDTCFMIQFGLDIKQDGRFVPIKAQYVDEFRDSELHWVKFRMWTYKEQIEWKQKCLVYNQTTKIQTINNDKLNEIKIKYLMKDWSFGIYQEKFKLLHCDGVLSDESMNLLKGMYPAIINTIMSLMNNVLENNQ